MWTGGRGGAFTLMQGLLPKHSVWDRTESGETCALAEYISHSATQDVDIRRNPVLVLSANFSCLFISTRKEGEEYISVLY